MKTLDRSNENNYSSSTQVDETAWKKLNISFEDLHNDWREFRVEGHLLRIGADVGSPAPDGFTLVLRRRFSTSFADLRKEKDNVDIFWPTALIENPPYTAWGSEDDQSRDSNLSL